MNQNKKISQTNKVENSENKDMNEKQKNENILKRVSIYQIKTKHPMFSYADSTTYHFSWKRIKRGLYKSKNGIYINADVKSIYENLSIFIHTLPFIHFMYS